MTTPWNEFELMRPNVLSAWANAENTRVAVQLNVRISRYFRVCKTASADLAHAAALLSRLKARRTNSFRRMIGFRHILKLNAALCRLLRIDLPRELNTFRSKLPDSDYESYDLPNRAFFDYLLVRVVSVYCVHQRIRECCLDAAEYFGKMIRNNFFMDILTLFLAVLAKVYSMSGFLGNQCAEFYNESVCDRYCFPLLKNCTLLETDDVLPEKLETFSEKHFTDVPKPSTSSDPVIQLSETLMRPLEAPRPSTSRQRVDTGVEVDRPTTSRPSFNARTELATVSQVQSFIAAQNIARNKSLRDCITKKISEQEWRGATKVFERKIRARKDKNAVILFRNFINSKI